MMKRIRGDVTLKWREDEWEQKEIMKEKVATRGLRWRLKKMIEYVTTEMHEEFVGQFEKMEGRFDEMNEKIKIMSEESRSI